MLFYFCFVFLSYSFEISNRSTYFRRDDSEVISATLRLSPQINYCHTQDSKTTVPPCMIPLLFFVFFFVFFFFVLILA
jgi:hypothetical protein